MQKPNIKRKGFTKIFSFNAYLRFCFVDSRFFLADSIIGVRYTAVPFFDQNYFNRMIGNKPLGPSLKKHRSFWNAICVGLSNKLDSEFIRGSQRRGHIGKLLVRRLWMASCFSKSSSEKKEWQE